MEENKAKKISVATVFLVLAIIAIVVMGVFIYKLSNDKNTEIQKSNELQTQVNTLTENVTDLQGKINTILQTINDGSSNISSNSVEEAKNTSSSSNESSNAKAKDYEDIILDGDYAIPDSDSGWDFTKDGKAASSGNVSVMQGTYKTTGKNTIEAHYTRSKLWDEMTSEVTTSDIDKYEYFTVEDGKVYWKNPNGTMVELKRYGEARADSFE